MNTRFPHHVPDTVLGNICARGHNHEGTGKSLRYASHGNCVMCAVENRRTRDAKMRAQKEARRHPTESTRVCTACHQELPLDQFSYKRAQRSFRCLKCWGDYHRDYLRRRPDVAQKCRVSAKATRCRNWIETLWRGSMSSAKSRGLEHSITLADMHAQWSHQGGRCHWLGIVLEPDARPRYPLKPSIDRLDPARGYVPGNFVFTSVLLNLGRQNCTQAEFMGVLDRLRAAFVPA